MGKEPRADAKFGSSRLSLLGVQLRAAPTNHCPLAVRLVSALEGKLPDGDTQAGVDIHLVPALDDPPALLEHAVDGLPRLLFRRHGLLVGRVPAAGVTDLRVQVEAG